MSPSHARPPYESLLEKKYHAIGRSAETISIQRCYQLANQTIPPTIHKGELNTMKPSSHSIHTEKRPQSRSARAQRIQTDSQCKSRLTTSTLRKGDVNDDADGVRLAHDDSVVPHGIRHGHPSTFLGGDRESDG
jgi:hypothetical protein